MYKKVESGSINEHRHTATRKELIDNNAEKIEPILRQMEQWSVLSNTLNYI